MDIPRRISHDNVELTQNLEVEVTQVAVGPLSIEHALLGDDLVQSSFRLLVLLNIVDQFAVRVMTGVQMGTVPEALVGLLINDGSEMLLGAHGVPLGLLAAISSAVVAVVEVLLGLELQGLNLFLISAVVLELNLRESTLASRSSFSEKREGALRRLSMSNFSSFSLGVASRFCC